MTEIETRGEIRGPRIPFIDAKWVSFFVHSSLRGGVSFEGYNQRLLVLIGLQMVFWSVFFGGMYLVMLESLVLPIFLGSVGLFGMGLLVGLRVTGNERVFSELASLTILVALTLLSLFTGGLSSPVLYWIALVPITYLSMRGFRWEVLVWMVMPMLALVVMVLMPEGLIDYRYEMNPGGNETFMFFSAMGLMLASLVMFGGRREMERWLMDSALGAEKALRQVHEIQEARIKESLIELIERAPEGVVVVEEGGIISYGNPSFWAFCGLENHGEETLEFGRYFRSSTDEALRWEWLEVARTEDALLVIEEGKKLPVRVAITPADLNGRTVHLLHVQNMSREKELQKRMAEMDRMITTGTLAAGVAHEINNPLSFVTSNVDFLLHSLEQGGLSEEMLQECLEEVQVGTGRMKKIVEDLQRLSQRQSTKEQEIDLATVLDSAIQMVAHRIEERAHLERNYGALPRIFADESGLAQVVLNLVMNAVQAIPPGNPKAHYVRVSTGIEGAEIVIEVADNGDGMSEKVRKQIFEPFFTTKGAGDGTGLGLSISENIMRGMNGRIEVESEEGKGSTMRVVLPLKMAVGEEEGSWEEAKSVELEDVVGGVEVMIIDDNELLLRSLRRQLERSTEVRVFTSAGEALEALRGGMRPDLLLCDLEMPVMSGVAFYEELQATGILEELGEIVFMTGGAYTAASSDFLENSGLPMLQKPFTVEDLQGYLRNENASGTAGCVAVGSQE